MQSRHPRPPLLGAEDGTIMPCRRHALHVFANVFEIHLGTENTRFRENTRFQNDLRPDSIRTTKRKRRANGPAAMGFHHFFSTLKRHPRCQVRHGIGRIYGSSRAGKMTRATFTEIIYDIQQPRSRRPPMDARRGYPAAGDTRLPSPPLPCMSPRHGRA